MLAADSPPLTTQETNNAPAGGPIGQLLLLPSTAAGNNSSSSSKLDALRTALEARAITSSDFHILQQEQDIRAFIQHHDLVDVALDVKRIIQERLSFFFLPTVSQLTIPVKKKTEIPSQCKDKPSLIDPYESIQKSPSEICGLHSCQPDAYYRCTIVRTKEVVTTSYRFYLDSVTPLQACSTSTTSVSTSKKTATNTNTVGTKRPLWFAAKKMKAGGGGLLFYQLEHTKDWIEKNAIGKVTAGGLALSFRYPYSLSARPLLTLCSPSAHSSPHQLTHFRTRHHPHVFYSSIHP